MRTAPLRRRMEDEGEESCSGSPGGGICLVPASLAAQAVTGTILGLITDTSGAVMPGVTVTHDERRHRAGARRS